MDPAVGPAAGAVSGALGDDGLIAPVAARTRRPGPSDGGATTIMTNREPYSNLEPGQVELTRTEGPTPMAHIDPILSTTPVARIAGPHQNTVATILRAANHNAGHRVSRWPPPATSSLAPG